MLVCRRWGRFYSPIFQDSTMHIDDVSQELAATYGLVSVVVDMSISRTSKTSYEYLWRDPEHTYEVSISSDTIVVSQSMSGHDISKKFALCDPGSVESIRTWIAKLNSIQSIHQEIRGYERQVLTARKNYEAITKSINQHIHNTQQLCLHESVAYYPDASGNNDSWYACNICQLESRTKFGTRDA